jgi:hypothetical protein
VTRLLQMIEIAWMPGPYFHGPPGLRALLRPGRFRRRNEYLT